MFRPFKLAIFRLRLKTLSKQLYLCWLSTNYSENYSIHFRGFYSDSCSTELCCGPDRWAAYISINLEPCLAKWVPRR